MKQINEYKGDKRKKEYKEWKKTYGIGDLVEDITKTTGIKKLVGDCEPCQKRKERLNRLLSFKRTRILRCLDDEQLQLFNSLPDLNNAKEIQPSEVETIVKLYAHVFAIQYKAKDFCSTCGTGRKLVKLYNKIKETI